MLKDSAHKPAYKFDGVEKVVNAVIGFIFYYRLAFVLAGIVLLGTFAYHTWNTSKEEEKLRNLATALTGGSIIIGIFYSILNYEYNNIRFKHDVESSKQILSFNAAFEWHKSTIVEHLKVTKKMYEENKHLIEENRSSDFFKILEENEVARASLVSVLNYFECISLGVYHGIMDETFIKRFFCTLFKSYYNDYEFYITYRRKKHHTPNAWINFTNLAQLWLKEN